MPKTSQVICTLAAVLSVALLLSIQPPCAFAQLETASMSGRITDQTGAVVPGVEVEIKNVNTNASQTVTTNSEGFYSLPALRPGSYLMNVRKQGFRTVTVRDLALNVQDTLARNFTLQVGSASESITVSGDVAKVNTDSAAVSTVVDSQFVENMPLNGRSFQSLIYMTPGVVITPSGAFGGEFSTNGQRTDTNYFTTDGVSANFSTASGGAIGKTLGGALPSLTSAGGTNGLVSVDAMQEFRIQTSSYAPEFGRSPGAQISIVTKSGTNRWHGSASDYIRNDVFDARNWFDKAQPENGNPAFPKPPLRQNDFGGTLGGPIWKDHTFFFFSYEGLRLRLPQIMEGYFYTASAKAAVTGPWAPVINATPTGTGALLDPTCDNVTKPCVGALNTGYSNPSHFDSYSLRVDHKLTDKVTIFARYSRTPSADEQIQGLNQDQKHYANTSTATAGITATISPTMVNDFRGNWSQQVGGFTYGFISTSGAVAPSNWAEVIAPGYGGKNRSMAYLFFAGGSDAGLDVGGAGDQTTKQLNFVNTLSKTVGVHQLKFGVDYRRIRPYEQPLADLLPVDFSWTSILSGKVDFGINLNSDSLTLHSNNWSVFGQDTWKVTPRLTLTYGLRWDINTPPVSDTTGKPLYSVTGVFENSPPALSTGSLWNTYRRGIAPRVGGAYQLNSKTTLRGGFGLFYDLPYGGALSYALQDFPYSRQHLFFGVPLDFSNPAFQPLPFTTQLGSSSQSLITVDPHLKLPVTYQWNAAIEREIGAQTLSATYVGAYGKNLLYSTYLQLPLTSSTGSFNANPTWNAGTSHYNSLQLKLMRRMSHGLQALVSYNYSHSSDMASNDYNVAASGNQPTFGSLSTVKLPHLTPSDYDYHHVISAAVSYELPKPAWGGKAGHAVSSGWALDSIYKFQSVPPLDVYMQEVDPVVGRISVRPALVPGQPLWIPDATQPAGKALNPAAFTLNADGTSNDALRNAIRSVYGISEVDLALRRRFNITERIKLDFRAEYFNLLNHPMFGGALGPGVWWGQCGGNTPTSCAPGPPYYGFQNPYFGKVYVGNGVSSVSGQTLNVGLGSQSPQYAPGGPRSGQFTLKLTF